MTSFGAANFKQVNKDHSHEIAFMRITQIDKLRLK